MAPSRRLWLAGALLALTACRMAPGTALDAYSASQGYYAPPRPAPARTVVCRQIVREIVCSER